jgi:hypothetical protein
MQVTFQQGVNGYAGCTDAWMSSFTGSVPAINNCNFGSHVNLLFGFESGFGIERALQRWNLSSIPAGAVCSAASLQLYDSNYVNRTVNTPTNIYQPSVANANWVAGTSSDTTEVGAVCWNYKAYNTVAWAGSAGASTPTTDYVNTSLASYTFVDGETGYKTIIFNAAGLTYIQSLFGGTGGAGFLIIGDEVNSNSLTHVNSADGANTPLLNITLSGISTIGSRLRPRAFAPGLAR